MRRLDADTFDRPWLILCEGKADKSWLDRLIAHNEVGDRFHVHHPGQEEGIAGGRGAFGPWLALMQATSPTFRDNVEAILIVSENDDDPEASFAEIVAGLRNTGGFGVPAQERTVARVRGYPNIVILMIPLDESGNLEELWLRAAYNKWPLREPLDNYVAATPATNWRQGKQSKMRASALLAATCEPKPDTSFADHWQAGPEFHVALDDECFTGIVNFLKGFDALLAKI